MKHWSTRLPLAGIALLAVFLLSLGVRGLSDTTMAMVVSSIIMFAACLVSAIHLMGLRAALWFALIAMGLGWFAEQMGASYGWFFGSYDYTDVLGPRVGDVPFVIPLMWFALTYMGYVISNLIVWRAPVDGATHLGETLWMSLLAAMIVTAYDLGADPYMVFVLKAWIMTKRDGAWFGETVQGFFGWVFVAFCIVLVFRLVVRKFPLQPATGVNRRHALLPVLIYAGLMAFQIIAGFPIETRAIAVFAMGIPVLCALAGWRHWKMNDASSQGETASGAAPHEGTPAPSADVALRWGPLLDRSQYLADKSADDTVARIVGTWAPLAPDADAQALQAAHGAQWRRLGQATALLNHIGPNGALDLWQATGDDVDADVLLAVQDYVRACQALPKWADAGKLQRAEALFMDHGPLSCILLFCASLPECYVMPDLAAVLHRAGQLERHTEYRIRSTAAMIFPVMMQGGLSGPSGTGRGQILKVRLIHATIRNLILHGHPVEAVGPRDGESSKLIPPHPALASVASMHAAMFAGGWDVGRRGLPCNQEELAYTLLTFSYVFLRGMRRLDIGMESADEEAFLHCWNVAASILGVNDRLLAHTMDEAQALFACMQARAEGPMDGPDVRPALGQALMQAMENSIPFDWMKPFAPLMTRYLCGKHTADLIGIDSHVSLVSRGLFWLMMSLVRLVDGLARLVWPQFSLSRLITRVLGYHLITRLLMDQTRSLKLPEHLLGHAGAMLDGWSHDLRAPGWVNKLEDRLTTVGSWRA